MRILLLFLLFIFFGLASKAQPYILTGVHAGVTLSSAYPRPEDATQVSVKTPSWNLALSIQKINEKENHWATGLVLFNESVRYDPYIYADQSVQVNHSLLVVPLEFGLHLRSPLPLMRIGIPFEADGGLVLSQNTRIYVDGQLKDQGEGLIFPAQPVNFYVQTGFYCEYQVGEKIEVAARFRLGMSGFPVIYNQEAKSLMFSGINCGFYYHLK